ncbi:DNA-binding protein [Candidatus Giovannonibacteria bacterium RIFCSPLOWO2_02_FULL_43_11b]|uniref:DNA-binding protein n=1 Tax=Candidatus Giovannonibacteria bacterium RIFCSPHIGHO2_12_FULL_43_15 TaxID=1798341 RepID=A0A1F5WPF7_9BACT|nr:MAG: DNA-binding protein [Candidatus Giovannonibacteria bacterium RIFCSPHIGHO2_01_FULL_43_100]OGF66701.1 MAG: DNA-binding protein [Candidatus Giovannonibacteria bacterium RIFCSPHIGHO2_02_FULL_43_32]OGF77477.1 MAG: DNA-binding protein [Candidatus Giovannonibacteria bacterium RIFCSPHIGHO2_12_FULL_43_15]OGF78848.1 MAG: DNA-binding protein [Candidatus Giovannonibacteria bacterium RIFCSPLOWO2_01_FULL_43_60]OGF89053.1 MAG: DNA-binding protein [Candidatus Giovannonibacteria bacterium RIFCSPLOWO2_02
MNKAELSQKLWELHSKKGMDVSKKHAEEVVDFVFDTIADTMKRGDEVSIAGFGTFVAKQRKARQARNPKTGAAVSVPAMKVPKFKAGKGLKDAVK